MMTGKGCGTGESYAPEGLPEGIIVEGEKTQIRSKPGRETARVKKMVDYLQQFSNIRDGALGGKRMPGKSLNIMDKAGTAIPRRILVLLIQLLKDGMENRELIKN